MAIRRMQVENFTVFDQLKIEFSLGINVLIGENATGKTHVLKLLYSACQAAKAKTTAVDFPQKIVKVFRPDDFNIGRLVRRKSGKGKSKVTVSSDIAEINISFEGRTKRWEADVTGSIGWEKQFSDLSSTFIPAKEILSNSHNLVQAIDKGNVDFDDTYKDLISAASIDVSSEQNDTQKTKYLSVLQNIINGKVKFENEEFYLQSGNQSKLEFQLVAEGMRKIALLWQLIKNGSLENGAVLFWDEPEANINPGHIPVLVDILLDLQKDGVQIFIATHDYMIAKYLELKQSGSNRVQFHSLYKSGDGIELESKKAFMDLEHNVIAKAYNQLLDEVFRDKTGV
mgnify:CR=1 FL=1